MSTPAPSPPPIQDTASKLVDKDAEDGAEGPGLLSKKALKKADKLAAKEAKRAAVAQQASASPVLRTAASWKDEYFGYLPMVQSAERSDRVWSQVKNIEESMAGTNVWVRCRVQESRCKGAIGFLVLRQQTATIQAVIDSNLENFGRDAVKWAGGVPLESIVDIWGRVVKPEVPVTATTQSVEIHLDKIFCVSKAAPELPFQLKDAARPDVEAKAAAESDEGLAITVGQDNRLDNRVLDLRTPANQAIFRIQSSVCQLFRSYLFSEGFTEIHTPKLLGGVSEGGANAFTFSYFGRSACLAQSPQLHKQMAICGDFDRVFEIGPVFRAENSHTHRHLCEFTGLDFEMSIKETYEEILEVLDNLFQSMFRGINETCQKELETIERQHPFEPFTWLPKAPRLAFSEGVDLLRNAGFSEIPADISDFDISTEQEKALGKIVKEKYGTDFFMMTRYPLNVRPFYTMPSKDNPTESNSYDVFMRGEEILSGGQRIHESELLIQRANAWKIPLDTLKPYIDAFKLGAYPHGGAGVGLERVVMLFLGLPNIRKTSLFPRDPKRLAP